MASLISVCGKQPRNLQKILQGFDQNGRFAQVDEAAESKLKIAQEDDMPPYEKMIKNIHKYAEIINKEQEPPEIRKIRQGVLSDIYPKAQRELAEKAILEKRENAYHVKSLTKLYRFCIYPVSKINAYKFCEKYRKENGPRYGECKHLNCVNCCNHLQLIMKYITSQSIVSETLGLNDDSGYNRIRSVVTPSVQKECRIQCQENYHMDEPVSVEPPPKDPELGLSASEPASSCIDILQNGGPAISGIYWLKPGKAEAFTAYCDQETDLGGWTLFFNYNHKPMNNKPIDSTSLPTEPATDNSHMNLQQLAFDSTDVMELRFFCQTSHTFQGKQIYMHFKSRNPDLIKVSMIGDQNLLSVKSWISKSEPLQINLDIFNEMHFSMSYLKAQEVGKSSAGGFWDSPFSGPFGGWTVSGSNKLGKKWECGDSLSILTDGPQYETKHQIFFRGQGPTDDEVEKRYLKKLSDQQEQAAKG